ncbi:MAG TPA: beta-ribofuranosylaminobenzene 5'-phosphate synthase family protein [Paracoccaceae bacterium]|nr:beta-ribofuranosylaminobenzene 5'-phosphate synthase family protein [Paracoccaceae bacterium]
MTPDVVSVSAPARLHLGFLDPGGSSGRRFGGVGMAIESPVTRLSLSRSSEPRFEGPEAERARSHFERLAAHLGIEGPHRLVVEEAMPAHSGLGSGTQLALAVAAALRTLHNLPLEPATDAARLGRGNRSGVGAGFFQGGGVVVDGGKGDSDRPPPIVARLPFPQDWRVILVLDPRTEGFHGEAEIEAFRALPAFAQGDSAEICRLVLMQALPGLAEADIAAFGAAIAAVQERVGSHFAPVQGGVFTSPAVARAMATLAALGAHGIGQSSWGPTGFAFAASETQARRLVGELRGRGEDGELDIRIVAGRNRGAVIDRSRHFADAG